MASLALGGATRGGFLSDAVLQLLAIPLFLVALWRIFETPVTKQARLAIGFCFAVAAVPLLQLIPLPPEVWTALPHRQVSAAAYDLMGQETPWMPISVSPSATYLSALSLIVPISIFLAVLMLSYRERRWLSMVVLAVGTVSVFIGLMQVAQGPQSEWRFFEVTNPTEAVGFFANRNHFAALCYSLFLLAAAWATNAAVGAGQASLQKHYDAVAVLAAIGFFTLLVVFLAGEAMARSRAGLGMTIVAVFGAFALGLSDRRLRTGFTPGKLIAGAIVLALVLSVQYSLYRILESFASDPMADGRLLFLSTTIEAAKAYMPVGSGLGSFVQVYALFEKPSHAMVDTYVNHAHNDVAELWLETGVLGILLSVLFVSWLAWRAVDLWRNAPSQGALEIDWPLARMATLIVALLIAHSFFDYPLRTGALMAMFAFACALLIEPPPSSAVAVDPVASRPKARQQSSREKEAAPAIGRAVALVKPATTQLTTTQDPKAAPKKAGERWGADVQWPEEWQKKPKSDDPEK